MGEILSPSKIKKIIDDFNIKTKFFLEKYQESFSFKTRLEQCISQKNKLEEEIYKIQDENIQLKDKIILNETLRKENASKNATIIILNNQIEKIKSLIAEKDLEIENNQFSMKQIQTENDFLKKEVQQYKSENEKIQTKLKIQYEKDVEKEKESLNKKIAEMKLEIENILQSQNEKKINDQKLIQTLENQISTLEQKLEFTENELINTKNLMNLSEDLKKELDSKSFQIKNLEENETKLKQEIAILQNATLTNVSDLNPIQLKINNVIKIIYPVIQRIKQENNSLLNLQEILNISNDKNQIFTKN